MRHELPFYMGVILEAALLLVAIAWGHIFGEPILKDLIWDWKGAVIGTVAVFPLFVFFAWTLKSQLPIFIRHRQVLEAVLRPLLGHWTVWQLAVISICAGVCEEVFFRGALQASLTARIGTGLSVSIVALLFGSLHLLSWTYGIIVTFIGVYLGLLYLFSGNLLVPIVTHALYDLIALVYFLRIHSPKHT